MSQESSLSELEMAKEYSTVLADTNDENGKPYGYTRPNYRPTIESKNARRDPRPYAVPYLPNQSDQSIQAIDRPHNPMMDGWMAPPD